MNARVASLSNREAAVVADEAEAAAFANMYACAPAGLQTQLGLRASQVGGATLLLAPGLPHFMFNRVMGLGLREEADAGQARAIIETYRAAGTPSWWLHWNPQGLPAGFERALEKLGFTVPARRSWAKMLRGTEAAPRVATDLTVDVAATHQADDAARAIATAFEMPPFMAGWLRALHGQPRWRVYAVTDGPQVVGGGCLFLAGDVAWLGMGAVLPSHRRRGGQGALMARRIADAIEAGARHIVTETGEPMGDESNPSLDNMKRCGFACVASRLNFAGPA